MSKISFESEFDIYYYYTSRKKSYIFINFNYENFNFVEI